MNFEVRFKCYQFSSSKELHNIESYRTADIENIDINIDKFSAANFLYRFSPNKFICDKYIFVLKFDDKHRLTNIMFKETDKEDSNIFLVINMEQVLHDINEGYIRIRTLEKMSSLLEFDFEDARKEDENGYIDEFDLETTEENEYPEDQ